MNSYSCMLNQYHRPENFFKFLQDSLHLLRHQYEPSICANNDNESFCSKLVRRSSSFLESEFFIFNSGLWILNSGVRIPNSGFWILNSGFVIPDSGFLIQNSETPIQHSESPIQASESWNQNFESHNQIWSLKSRFWIQLNSRTQTESKFVFLSFLASSFFSIQVIFIL